MQEDFNAGDAQASLLSTDTVDPTPKLPEPSSAAPIDPFSYDDESDEYQESTPEESSISDESAKARNEEIDKAIEERRLSDLSPALYEYDAAEREYEIESHGVNYKALLKMPKRDDELRKEAMSVTVRKNAGRFQGDDLVSSVTDNARALRRFFDALALKVWGYGVDENSVAEQWLDVSLIVDDSDPKNPVDLLSLIPDSDKLKFAAKVHGAQTYAIGEKGKRIASVKSRREWAVKQVFGAERDDTGAMKPPTNIIGYHFREGSAEDIGNFDTNCTTTKTLIKKQEQPENRTVINVTEAVKLFDKLITYVQGASINGEEVRSITFGDARLASIPDRCKIDAVFIYMNSLKS